MHYFAKKSIDGLRLLPTYCVERHIYKKKKLKLPAPKLIKFFRWLSHKKVSLKVMAFDGLEPIILITCCIPLPLNECPNLSNNFSIPPKTEYSSGKINSFFWFWCDEWRILMQMVSWCGPHSYYKREGSYYVYSSYFLAGTSNTEDGGMYV